MGFCFILPERCHDYDLYRGYKVVVNEPRPYLHHEEYRSRYAHYRGYYDHQPALKNIGINIMTCDEDGPGNGQVMVMRMAIIKKITARKKNSRYSI